MFRRSGETRRENGSSKIKESEEAAAASAGGFGKKDAIHHRSIHLHSVVRRRRLAAPRLIFLTIIQLGLKRNFE